MQFFFTFEFFAKNKIDYIRRMHLYSILILFITYANPNYINYIALILKLRNHA